MPSTSSTNTIKSAIEPSQQGLTTKPKPPVEKVEERDRSRWVRVVLLVIIIIILLLLCCCCTFFYQPRLLQDTINNITGNDGQQISELQNSISDLESRVSNQQINSQAINYINNTDVTTGAVNNSTNNISNNTTSSNTTEIINQGANGNFVLFNPVSTQVGDASTLNSLISLTQIANSTNPLIYVNEASSGSQALLQLEVASNNAFTVNNNGQVQINNSGNSAWLNLPGAQTNYSSLNIGTSTGVDPLTPSDGDVWWNGTNLYFNNAGSNVDLLGGGSFSVLAGNGIGVTGGNPATVALGNLTADWNQAGIFNINQAGGLSVNGNTILGNANSDTISLNGRINTNITPFADNTYDLGSLDQRWRDIYLGPGSLNLTSTLGTSGSGLNYTLAKASFSGNTLNLSTANVGSATGGAIGLQSALAQGNGTLAAVNIQSLSDLTSSDYLLNVGDTGAANLLFVRGNGTTTINATKSDSSVDSGLVINGIAGAGGTFNGVKSIINTDSNYTGGTLRGYRAETNLTTPGVFAGSASNGFVNLNTVGGAGNVEIFSQTAFWASLVNSADAIQTNGQIGVSLAQSNSGQVSELSGVLAILNNEVGGVVLGGIRGLETQTNNFGTVNNMFAINASTENQGTVSASLFGIRNDSINRGSVADNYIGDLTSMRFEGAATIAGDLVGNRILIEGDQAVTGSIYGIELDFFPSTFGATAQNQYGVHINGVNNGSVNNYGLYIGGATGGSGDNYPLYINAGDAYLSAGGVRVGNTTNAVAGMIRWTGGDFEGYDGANWQSFTAGGGGQWVDSGSDIYFQAGNVGVGTTTLTEALNVSGNIRVENSILGISLNADARPLITRGFSQFVSGNYAGVGRWGLFLENGHLTLGIPDNPSEGVRFSAYNDDSSIAANLMTVKASGNVGIGFDDPTSRLQVNGNIAFSDTFGSLGGGNSRFIGIPCSVAGSFCNDSGASIEFTQGGTNADSNDLRFYTHQSGVSAGERMRLDEAGNLGIGLVPGGTYKLEVNGVSSSNGLVLQAGSGSQLVIFRTIGNGIYFGNGGAEGSDDIVTEDGILNVNGAIAMTGACSDGDGADGGADGCDLAETFASDQTLQKGELVRLDATPGSDWKKIERTSAKSDNAIGIISTNPTLVMGNNPFTNSRSYPVGLTGVLPTKVVAQNGLVKRGDFVTVSDTAGAGMRANNGDLTVGIALEDQKQNADTINVLVSRNNGATTNNATAANSSESGVSSVEERLANLEAAMASHTDSAALAPKPLDSAAVDATGIDMVKLGLAFSLTDFISVKDSVVMIAGKLDVAELETKKLTIKGNRAGEAVVEEAKTEVTIKVIGMKTSAKVILTPTSEVPQGISYWITKESGQFKVKLSAAAAAELKFDYFVID